MKPDFEGEMGLPSSESEKVDKALGMFAQITREQIAKCLLEPIERLLARPSKRTNRIKTLNDLRCTTPRLSLRHRTHRAAFVLLRKIHDPNQNSGTRPSEARSASSMRLCIPVFLSATLYA